MKRVLLVDDDALVLRIYCTGLLSQGFHVEVAADGLAALKAVHANKPDVLVLDLLMPKFSGFDVLKLVRGNSNLDGLPVILLSSSYLSEPEHKALAKGANRELLKSECTPAKLGRVIREILPDEPFEQRAPSLAAPRRPESPVAKPARVPLARSTAVPARPARPSQEPDPESDEPLGLTFRQDFVVHARDHSRALRDLFVEFKRAPNQLEREMRLTNLFRKVHFLTAVSSLASLPLITQMSGALEAMLFRLSDKAEAEGPLVQQTIATAVDCLNLLLDKVAADRKCLPRACAEVMVVDDDPVCSRLVVTALHQAELTAQTIEDPLLALEKLRAKTHDLVFLDVEMPSLDGIELCRRLRAVPGYEKTPVIFITVHDDLNTRALALHSGATGLITKPIMPTEVAVKALMALIKSRLSLPAAASLVNA